MVAQQTLNDELLKPDLPINILAVEDDNLSMSFLEAQISQLGYDIMQAENGLAAIETLERHSKNIDVVLMDREMPVMDGLTAVRRIKDKPELRNIPIIMVTGADSIDEMKAGLDAGVFYYLTKPVEDEMLRSVLSAAVREAEKTRILSNELRKHRTSFNLIETCRFRFKTLSEAESLTAFMANCFPEPERVVLGLGELLINALEHGNLEVGYDGKTELIENNIWRSEIQRLQTLPEHREKEVIATISHKEEGTYAIIEDQGGGFEWQKYMKIDPSRAGDNHGRGIAKANTMSFDKLTYNDMGNKAVAFVGSVKQLDW